MAENKLRQKFRITFIALTNSSIYLCLTKKNLKVKVTSKLMLNSKDVLTKCFLQHLTLSAKKSNVHACNLHLQIQVFFVTWCVTIHMWEISSPQFTNQTCDGVHWRADKWCLQSDLFTQSRGQVLQDEPLSMSWKCSFVFQCKTTAIHKNLIY